MTKKNNLSPFRKMFSMRLRGSRLYAGFETAREFSARIEEEENTYTRWERGETLPGIEQLLRICMELGVTPNDLIWGERQTVMPDRVE